MEKSLKEIFIAFKGKLLGTSRMKRYVCEVLSLMEQEIINFVTAKCWFASSMEDAWAFTLTGNDLKDQHLIILSDDLFRQSSQQIRYTIAHEIGHVILGHRNSILERQNKSEIAKQEKGADKFARKYLNIF